MNISHIMDSDLQKGWGIGLIWMQCIHYVDLFVVFDSEV
jgi:hypothetical protein